MPKTLSIVSNNRKDDEVVYPIFKIDLLFDSPNELRMWTGVGEIEIGGNIYIGTGEVVKISDVEESSLVEAKGITLTAEGISSNIISLALQEPYQGRICEIAMTLMSSHDEKPLGGAFNTIFSGYMDTMIISEQGETCTVEIGVENRLVDLERPRVARYTNAYQQKKFPGDLGLEFIEDIQDRVTRWGKADPPDGTFKITKDIY